MLIFVYLFSLAFVLPAFLLAYVANAFIRTQGQASLMKMIGYALNRFLNAFSWHLLTLVPVLISLMVLGFFENVRWIGSMLIGFSGVGSLGYLWLRCRVPDELGQIILFLPSWIGTVAAVWLTVVDPHAPWTHLSVAAQP